MQASQLKDKTIPKTEQPPTEIRDKSEIWGIGAFILPSQILSWEEDFFYLLYL